MEELLNALIDEIAKRSAEKIAEYIHLPAEFREYVTREEAAKYLGCSKATVTKYAKEMEEKGYPGIQRTSRQFLRIDKMQLANYLEERKAG